MCLGYSVSLLTRFASTGWKPVSPGAVLSLLVAATAWGAEPTTRRVLRISSDPNNLPFSNEKLEGFENRIAVVVAKDLGADVEYVWRAQRRGFFRESFKTDGCDLIMGAPKEFDKALTTNPYYRSSYVFVSRKDRKIDVTSFDDEALRTLKIGVQITGDANTPPAQALGRRGMWKNVVGYTVYGDYKEANPPAAIVGAVAKGDVAVAVVWGPLAGYFAKKEKVELCLAPVSPEMDGKVPMAFDISMAVAKKNVALRDELNQVIGRHKDEIEKILEEYGVPRTVAVEPMGAR
jgi:mxaJ protein